MTIKRIKLLIEIAEFNNGKADKALKQLFPPGKVIVFRAGKMKENHNAEVIWSRVWSMYAEIRIKNLFTNKERTITLDDVVS